MNTTITATPTNTTWNTGYATSSGSGSSVITYTVPPTNPNTIWINWPNTYTWPNTVTSPTITIQPSGMGEMEIRKKSQCGEEFNPDEDGQMNCRACKHPLNRHVIKHLMEDDHCEECKKITDEIANNA